MNITFAQFADFAEKQSGPYDVNDTSCCPMAEVAKTLVLDETLKDFVANESSVWAYHPTEQSGIILRFPIASFFTKFVEPFSTWEDLAKALRRAANEESRT